MMHDPRCTTLTSIKFPEVCDCRTLKLLDEGGAFGGATWKGCEIPPRGWWCSREKGHAPPSAARHVSGRDWPDTRPTDPPIGGQVATDRREQACCTHPKCPGGSLCCCQESEPTVLDLEP